MQLRVFTGEAADRDGEPAVPAGLPEEYLLGQYIPLHYHYNMLLDATRVGAFQEAIRFAVKPGMHVVELGGGTGILSSFAARQGARVSCVERNPQLVRKARQLIDANGLADRVEVIESDAFAYLPSEPVDVVICEMLHVAMLREKQLAVIDSFKRRYQRAFGESLPRFLPEASILMAQPVDHSFDFAGYWAPIPVFQTPAPEIEGTRPLAPLAPYANISYDSPLPDSFEWSESMVVAESGTVTAIRFVTQNAIAIDLDQQRAISWPNQCLVLPVEEPISVEAGQVLRIGFRYQAGASIDELAESLTLERRATATATAERRAA
ncbi:methyltransferase domain-containing protein [Candidatus Laterigemmans baculatus]|uniref:methyltransferase domain-containing protein n=1 Tax=Candidatus Laterigemmans baculatus TaxID=2770505 RepID=UPI0013DD8290|nr:methyltransferase domain-containing protein [Candidatus Laterigemmans baculatus]